MFGGGKERRIGEYKARHVETEPGGANLHMSRFVSHPAGAELGGVRVTADTARENQWAHTEAGEKPPSVAYESDAVRRLDTMRRPPAGSADGRRRRSGQIGGVCHFKRELTKRAVCEAGRAAGSLPFRTSLRAESGWGGVVAASGNLGWEREKNGNRCFAKFGRESRYTLPPSYKGG